MRTKVVKLLFKKELLDVFRDKKAVLMMILVPVLLYPLIFFGTMAVMSKVESSLQTGTYRVVNLSEDDGALANAISAHNASMQAEADKSGKAATDILTLVNGGLPDLDSAKKSLKAEKIDAIITSYTADDGKTKYMITYMSSITNSSYARGIILDVLEEMSQEKTKSLIREAGLKEDDILVPYHYDSTDIASKEQSAGSLLGNILPFLLVVSLLMGTMYPAIDTTAGEKERGTLETLLTLPVKNREIIVSKFLTVALVGVISALMNVLSMGLMFAYMLKLMSSAYMKQMGFDISSINFGQFIPAIILSTLAIIVFSLFLSAVTMCITAFAKSYKEANNYITPLTLVVMLTSYIAFVPNIELTPKIVLIPVANICLLIKQLLIFKLNLPILLMVLVANVFYAGLAIMFLGKIYNSEEILFDDGKSGVQIFQRRSNMKKGGVPTSGDAWFMTIFMMVVYLFVGGYFSAEFGENGVWMTQALLFVVPFAFVLYTKRSIKKTYNFRSVRPLAVLGGLCILAGGIVVGAIMSTFISALFPEEASKTATDLYNALPLDNIWISLLVIAVLPAVVEELLFRGFLFTGFTSKYGKVVGIILTSVIFGVYHLSLIRFVGTAFLGLLFAYVISNTGCIFITMMMHAMNNGLAVLELYYPGFEANAMPFLPANSMSIMGAVVSSFIGVFLIFAGVLIFRFVRRGNENQKIKKEKAKTIEE